MARIGTTLVAFLVSSGFLTISCGKGGSSGGGDSDGGSDSSTTETGAHSFNVAPSTLAVQIPNSLTNKKSASLALTQDSPPGTGESQGYWEITEKIRRVQAQLAELSMNNAILDAVILANCDFDASASCEATNACSKFTTQMKKAMEEAMGAERMADGGELEKMGDKVDQEICFQSVKITKLTDDAEKFDFKAKMVMDDKNSTDQFWSSDKKRVKVTNQFEDDFDDFGGAPPALTATSGPTFKGTSTFFYDADTKAFKARNTFSMTFGSDTTQGEETFTIQGVTGDGADANKVYIKGKIQDDSGGNAMSLAFEGTADDNGGFVRTQMSFSNYEITTAELSSACEDGKEYWFYANGTAATDLTDERVFHKQIGGFNCDQASTTLDASSVFLMGIMPPDPTKLALFTVSFDDAAGGGAGGGDIGDPFALLEEDFFPDVTASSVKFATLTGTRSTTNICYEEQFTKTGEMTAWRAGNGDCDSAAWESTNGGFTDSYTYDESSDAGNFQGTKVELAGGSAKDIQDESQQSEILPMIYILPGDSELADTVTDMGDAFHKALIGTAWATEPDADALTDMSQYEFEFWGHEGQISGAKIYMEVWSTTDGAVSAKRIESSGGLFDAFQKAE